MAFKYNLEDLYTATNQGLEIIRHYLSNCEKFDVALNNPKKHFHFRDSDKTASAQLIPPGKVISKTDGTVLDYWRVHDHGGESYTPIKLAMDNSGLEFYNCLVMLYDLFKLEGAKGVFFSPEKEFKTLEKNDKRKPGWFNIVKKEKVTNLDLIGRFVTEDIAKKYHFYSIDYYESIFLNGKTQEVCYLKITATDQFPIFAYMPDGDKWAKTYAPLAQSDEKGAKYKHGYLGEKPARFVHGLAQIQQAFDKEMKNFDEKIAQANRNKENLTASNLEKEKAAFKLPFAVGCSGGSDGMNVSSLDNHVFWYNSEAEKINFEEYTLLKKLVHVIYNLPDVDNSGVKYGYAVAEDFWNLKTIWLPKEKLGTNGKDFRNWMDFYKKAPLQTVKYQFSNLLVGALKMKFFDRNKAGTIKINTANFHYFLKVKGFYIYYPEKIYMDKTSEQEFIFIRIENNIVNQEFPNTIKKFCEKYMIDKGQSLEVINLIKNTTQFTEKNLLGLDAIELNFKNFTADSQTFYFKNNFVTVTAENIEFKSYDKLQNHVWSDKILNYNISKEKPFFSYTVQENGTNKLEILRNDCEYMNFLINTSRIFWRKELEDSFTGNSEDAKAYHNENRFRLTSDFLAPQENQIQEQHFTSKLFGGGYMLHRYKRKSFARLLYIMDDKEKEGEDDRNGGSGKTMILDGLDCLLNKRFKIDGSLPNLFQNPFLLGGLTKENDYILIDDLAANYTINPIYVWITGSLTARPLYKPAHEISFFDVGKIATTRNFGLKDATGSSLRRIFFISTSDYYHMKSDDYNEERRVSHDFGHDLFLWDEKSKQPNLHFNFLFQMLQFYLQHRENEILAPQKNIDLNNIKAGMGDVFIEWADSYFAETMVEETASGIYDITKGTLNEYVARAEMQESYKQSAGKFPKTSSNFKKSLQTYCKMKGYVFNPKEMQGSDGLIKKPFVDGKGKRQIVEHFYIKTPDAELKLETPGPVATKTPVAKHETLPLENIDDQIDI